MSINTRTHTKKGFSLIEMMVAVALFSVVMLVSTGALLALIDAARKAQALQSVMSNLNTALDGMVRSMRMGSTFHCGDVGGYDSPRDCSEGDLLFAFEPFGGDSSTTGDQWVYAYVQDPVTGKGRLYKSENGGGAYFPLTAPEVQIDSFAFYVVGTTPGDTQQPKVIINVKGTAGVDRVKTRSTFSIQATAVQRVLDLAL